MKDIVARLIEALPEGRVSTDPMMLTAYAQDQARFLVPGAAAAVVLPKTTEEVQTIVRQCAQTNTVIVPRGGGSGLSGGANAIDGCVVLSLERMNEPPVIDAANQIAIVQPGVITADVDRAAKQHGLTYPPDPSSYEMSTIGGNVATNAGGLCCVKYGVTGDFVLGLEVVLADGSVVRTGRRTRKGVAGYDLTHLFVGSEGTLGIVTEATLRLRPARKPPATLVASFATLEAAGRAISSITREIVPSLLELMDRTTIRAVESVKQFGLDTEAAALILAQSDTGDKDELDRIEALCSEATFVARSSDPAEAELLMSARRLALPGLEKLGNVMPDDVAVPPAQIPALLKAIEEIGARHSLVIGTLGHAGEGNMHPTIVFNASDDASTKAAYAAFGEILDVALKLGGTITGEHGVGVLKRKFLPQEVKAEGMRLHEAIKNALDPNGIFNPGKGF